MDASRERVQSVRTSSSVKSSLALAAKASTPRRVLNMGKTEEGERKREE